MIGAVTGHRVVIVVDPKLPPAYRRTMLAYGAEVVEVSERDDSGGYFTARLETANRIAREIGGFRPDQHFSLMNAAAHFQETGPEILAQMQGRIDYLVVAVSTAGQLRGLSEFIRQHSLDTQIIGVDAVGSGAFGGERHAYLQSGIGLAWPPSNLALDLVDSLYEAGDADAFATCHHLARREGILAGASSGAVTFVGLHLAQRAAVGARILCMLSDSGQRYLETIYDKEWLAAHDLQVDIPLSGLHERAVGLQVLPGESVAASVRVAQQFAPVNDRASTRLLNQAARELMRKEEPCSESGEPASVFPEGH
jgi:cysteine synthase